jgi:hypothetical protein
MVLDFGVPADDFTGKSPFPATPGESAGGGNRFAFNA